MAEASSLSGRLTLLITFLILNCHVSVEFEDGLTYTIRSTTSTLIFGLQNGNTDTGASIISESSAESEIEETQQWYAKESGVNPDYFYLRGKQHTDGQTRLISLIDGLVVHSVDDGVSGQRWTFDEFCSTGSGWIRNHRNDSICLQDNGLDEALTAEQCSFDNSGMLWKIYPVIQ